MIADEGLIVSTRWRYPSEADRLAQTVDWDEFGWPNWSNDRPVVITVLDARLPVVASHLSRNCARRRAGVPDNGNVVGCCIRNLARLILEKLPPAPIETTFLGGMPSFIKPFSLLITAGEDLAIMHKVVVLIEEASLAVRKAISRAALTIWITLFVGSARPVTFGPEVVGPPKPTFEGISTAILVRILIVERPSKKGVYATRDLNHRTALVVKRRLYRASKSNKILNGAYL